MRTRVDAMLQAVQVARPALDKFYQSLSDEQKERFNVIDQEVESTDQRQADIAGLCQRTRRNAGPLLDRTDARQLLGRTDLHRRLLGMNMKRERRNRRYDDCNA